MVVVRTALDDSGLGIRSIGDADRELLEADRECAALDVELKREEIVLGIPSRHVTAVHHAFPSRRARVREGWEESTPSRPRATRQEAQRGWPSAPTVTTTTSVDGGHCEHIDESCVQRQEYEPQWSRGLDLHARATPSWSTRDDLATSGTGAGRWGMTNAVKCSQCLATGGGLCDMCVSVTAHSDFDPECVDCLVEHGEECAACRAVLSVSQGVQSDHHDPGYSSGELDLSAAVPSHHMRNHHHHHHRHHDLYDHDGHIVDGDDSASIDGVDVERRHTRDHSRDHTSKIPFSRASTGQCGYELHHSCYRSSGYTHCPSCSAPLVSIDAEFLDDETSSDVNDTRSALRQQASNKRYNQAQSPPRRAVTERRQHTSRTERRGGTNNLFYPPAHPPWIPANPATGRSNHISVIAKRIDGNIHDDVDDGIGVDDDLHSTRVSRIHDDRKSARDRQQTARTGTSGYASWSGPSNTMPSHERQAYPKGSTGGKQRKGHTQLDRLADMVYDALMCNTVSQRRN